ncbi:MAG: M56 family metallopeptidase [Gemmatimonadota bacterium]|jgi:beta-lactamase regulating signal transducer with metallopeptidase domain
MIGYGMIYAALVGVPILLAAFAGSRALRRYGQPERGVWLAALALALLLPLAFMTVPRAVNMTPSTVPGVQPDAGLEETGVLGLTEFIVVPQEAGGPGVDTFLIAAWLLASLALALRWTVAAKRLANVGASWRPRAVNGIHVWQTPDLGPAVSGVFRPRILVPEWMMSMPKDQRALVLLHEQEHIRARDPVVMAGARLARILAPWNPVVWLLASRLRHALELDCDRRVLRRQPDIGIYGDTLLQVSARETRPLIAAAAFTESHVPLQKRILAMTTPPRTASVLGITAALTLAVLLVMASCEVPIPTRQGSEEQQSVVESSGDNVVRLQANRDGSVVIDGESYRVEEVSEVVRPLYEASDGKLAAYIGGDGETPYRVMDRLQSELVEAGVLRVVFEIPETAPSMSTSGLEKYKDEGLPVVLPGGEDGPRPGPARPVTGEPGPGEVRVSARNILEMVVRANGIVEVRRGDSSDLLLVTVGEIGTVWLAEVASNPNLIAVVKTDPEAPYRSMTEVLSALQEARAERISVQVLETR